jgi:hypothetical protein
MLTSLERNREAGKNGAGISITVAKSYELLNDGLLQAFNERNIPLQLVQPCPLKGTLPESFLKISFIHFKDDIGGRQ